MHSFCLNHCNMLFYSVILQKPYFKHSTILSELDKLTSDQMLQHAKNLFKSFNTTCLIHGNVLKEKVCVFNCMFVYMYILQLLLCVFVCLLVGVCTCVFVCELVSSILCVCLCVWMCICTA